jgi:hypothetical protein
VIYSYLDDLGNGCSWAMAKWRRTGSAGASPSPAAASAD